MYLGEGTAGTYLPLPLVLARFRLHSTRVKCPNRNLNGCVRVSECIRHEPATWPIRGRLSFESLDRPWCEADESVSLGVSVAAAVSRRKLVT